MAILCAMVTFLFYQIISVVSSGHSFGTFNSMVVLNQDGTNSSVKGDVFDIRYGVSTSSEGNYSTTHLFFAGF